MCSKFKMSKKFNCIVLHRVFINLGDSLYYIVLMWLLYEISYNSIYTSIGGFMFSLPQVFNFFVGPIIDRGNKVKLLKLSSMFQLVVIFTLFLLQSSEYLNIWVLIISIPLFTMTSEISYSIENTILPSILDKNELIRGNSILSIMGTGIDLMFNALAGILLSIFTIKFIFGINTLINLIALLFAIRFKQVLKNEILKNQHKDINTFKPKLKQIFKKYVCDLKESLIFVKNKLIFCLLIPLIFLSALYAMMIVNLPKFSQIVFGSAFGYGLVLTLFAFGSIIGSFFSNYFSRKIKIGNGFLFLFLVAGVSWILMGIFAQVYPYISAIFIILASTMLGIINIEFATIFQQLPSATMIGRVNTLNLSLIACAASIGSLIGGFVEKWTGVYFLFILCGIGYLIIGIFMFLIKEIRNMPKLNQIQNIK